MHWYGPRTPSTERATPKASVTHPPSKGADDMERDLINVEPP